MKKKQRAGNEVRNRNKEQPVKQDPGNVPMRDPYKEPAASGGKPPTKEIRERIKK